MGFGSGVSRGGGGGHGNVFSYDSKLHARLSDERVKILLGYVPIIVGSLTFPPGSGTCAHCFSCTKAITLPSPPPLPQSIPSQTVLMGKKYIPQELFARFAPDCTEDKKRPEKDSAQFVHCVI